MSANPIDGFTLTKDDFKFIGSDLQRPECILAEKDGTLWSADARGGVVRIAADGSQSIITQSHDAEAFETTNDEGSKFIDGTLPNGLAFASNGDILISNFGTDCLERMTRTGETEVMFDSVDGEEIGKVNFVARDSKNRIWITISTMLHDWPKAISPDIVDGRILLYEEGKGVRIVADDVHFSNECKLDANEEWLYVVQTCGRNIARYKIAEDGSLSGKEIYGPTDHGRLIDGIAFDSFGNLWGTHVMNDGLFAIKPDGDLQPGRSEEAQRRFPEKRSHRRAAARMRRRHRQMVRFSDLRRTRPQDGLCGKPALDQPALLHLTGSRAADGALERNLLGKLF
jgi:gluconolactonase